MIAIISYVSIILNWTFNQLASIIHTLLKVNYTCVSIVVHFLTNLKTSLTSIIHGTSHIFCCYVQDFIVFLDECGTGVIIVSKFLTEGSYLIFISLYRTFCTIFDFLYVIYSGLCTGIISFYDMVNFSVNTLKHCLTLIFSAILLLLQCIPDSFVLLFQGVWYLIYGLLRFMQYFVLSIVNGTCQIPVNLYNVILDIPLKAYFGFVFLSMIFIVFYYLYQVIIEKVRSFLYVCVVFSVLVYVKTYCALSFVFIEVPRDLFVKWKRRRELRQQHSHRVRNVHSSTSRLNRDCDNNSVSLFQKLFRQMKSKKFKKSNTDESTDLKFLQQRLREEEGKHLCIICQDENRSVILLPCRHFCLCEQCSLTLRMSTSECPVCRQEIQSAINVYT